MMLVASFVLYDLPIIIGDMLVSVDGPHIPGQQLPSTGPLTNLPPTRAGVHGLRQKIAIISDNVAIAFANEVSSAMVVISSLRRLAEKNPLTVDTLKSFFDSEKLPALKKVAIVGFIITPSGGGKFTATQIEWQSQVTDMGHLGMVNVAGTGAALLNSSAVEMTPNPPNSTRLPIVAAMTTALSICGALVREEHATASTIANDATGGSYEVAYFNGKKFVKEPEITFVAWDVEAGEGRVSIDYPYLILRQYYDKENAVIEVARIEAGAAPTTPRYSLFTHVIPPAHRSRPTDFKIPIGLMSFNSPTTVHSILVKSGSNMTVHSIVEKGISALSAEEVAPGVFTHHPNRDLLKAIYGLVGATSC